MNEKTALLKETLETLYQAALAGADPEAAVARALGDPRIRRALGSARRLGVFAAGKAATAMLAGARSIEWEGGLAVVPRGYPAAQTARVRVLFASHPQPDRSSVEAARRALAFFATFGPADCIVCLISGGTSALVAKPRPGFSLAAKRAAVARLASSGASIRELNLLRSRLSSVKAGRLGRATPARLITLVLSDVAGDDPALVGSGPTVRKRRGDITRVVATNRSGLTAALRQAARCGLSGRIFGRRLCGEAREQGFRFARAAKGLAPGEALIGGGETTVVLPQRHGRGGRNLEFALAAAREIDGREDLAVLAAGSDGIDGSARAAGAFVDGTTMERSRHLGLSAEETLRRHETERFFQRMNDLLMTGPTQTNVGDWALAVRRPT